MCVHIYAGILYVCGVWFFLFVIFVHHNCFPLRFGFSYFLLFRAYFRGCIYLCVALVLGVGLSKAGGVIIVACLVVACIMVGS